MAHLKMYTIAEKAPLPDQDVIKWVIYSGVILDVQFTSVEVQVADDPEDRALIPTYAHPNLVWSTGGEVHWDDVWSPTTI